MADAHQSAPDEMPVSGPSSERVAPGSEEEGSSQSGMALVRRTTPAKRKEPVKRKAGSREDKKSKKRKKSNVRRVQRPNYTVQHGEDMLLIISNINHFDSVWKPKRKICKKKKTKAKTAPVKGKKKPSKPLKKVTEEAPVSNASLEEAESSDWGQRLPVVVLVKILELVALQEGAVPFLCR